MVSINAVIGVVGATVILLSLGGLVEIHSRAGPLQAPLAPVEFVVTYTGTYAAAPARGTIGPGNICVPAAGETACTPPRLRVDLAVSGLPRLPSGANYHVFLVGAQLLALGVLEPAQTEHRIHYDEARDGRDFRTLSITAEAEPSTSPGPLQVLAIDVAGKGQTAPAPIAGSSTTTFGRGVGTVRAAEIGAFAKSSTAVGDLSGLPELPGWTYQAWFVTTQDAYIYLGPWEVDGKDPSRASLDGRVERIRLEDQGRFITTLEPRDAVMTDAPLGAVAFHVEFPTHAETMG